MRMALVANPVNHVRLQRPLAGVLLVLVLTGVVVGTVRAVRAAGTAPGPGGGALPGELRGPAPWPANGSDLRARLAVLGLPALAREGTAFHIHAHLDVFVNGKRVLVPAGIGIDPDGRFISPLHTHDATGIIHVESPTVRAFTLGEFFGVWGVRFGDGCLGGYCSAGGRTLRVYVDGSEVADPSVIVLSQHEEIAVTFGTRRQLPRPVPAKYEFPPGL
jgi:hypothetical protein